MSQHLRNAIENLKRNALFLGAVVEGNLQKAVDSVSTRDLALAGSVISSDTEIDQMEVEIEEECLKMLALYQPVAADLRFIIAVIKLNNDLERIGDLAASVAEHSAYLASRDPIEIPDGIRRIAERAAWMLKDALDSLVNSDPNLARTVCAADDEVDALNRRLFDQVQESMRKDVARIDLYVRLLSISRQLERVADHATNIAEDVVYMVKGAIIRHKGPQ